MAVQYSDPALFEYDCPKCGYEVTNLVGQVDRCPECGEPMPYNAKTWDDRQSLVQRGRRPWMIAFLVAPWLGAPIAALSIVRPVWGYAFAALFCVQFLLGALALTDRLGGRRAWLTGSARAAVAAAAYLFLVAGLVAGARAALGL